MPVVIMEPLLVLYLGHHVIICSIIVIYDISLILYNCKLQKLAKNHHNKPLRLRFVLATHPSMAGSTTDSIGTIHVPASTLLAATKKKHCMSEQHLSRARLS